jgi:hypothetical protein
MNLYGFANNSPVDRTDKHGLFTWGSPGQFNWGTPGPFIVGPDASKPNYTSYTRTLGPGPENWMLHRPGENDLCCAESTSATWTRNDVFHYGPLNQIVMKGTLDFAGGPHKELIVLWHTCYRPVTETTDYMPSCVNKLLCQLPTLSWEGKGPGALINPGMYITRAEISYLSCEDVGGGVKKWQTKYSGPLIIKYWGTFWGWTTTPQ